MGRVQNWRHSSQTHPSARYALMFVEKCWYVLQENSQVFSMLSRLPELRGLSLSPPQTGSLPLLCPLFASCVNKLPLYYIVRYINVKTACCISETNMSTILNKKFKQHFTMKKWHECVVFWGWGTTSYSFSHQNHLLLGLPNTCQVLKVCWTITRTWIVKK